MVFIIYLRWVEYFLFNFHPPSFALFARKYHPRPFTPRNDVLVNRLIDFWFDILWMVLFPLFDEIFHSSCFLSSSSFFSETFLSFFFSIDECYVWKGISSVIMSWVVKKNERENERMFCNFLQNNYFFQLFFFNLHNLPFSYLILLNKWKKLLSYINLLSFVSHHHFFVFAFFILFLLWRHVGN